MSLYSVIFIHNLLFPLYSILQANQVEENARSSVEYPPQQGLAQEKQALEDDQIGLDSSQEIKGSGVSDHNSSQHIEERSTSKVMI